MRKQPVGPLDPWGWDAEPGDRVYGMPFKDEEGARIYDLKESTGRNKRDAGELTPCLVKKNGGPRRGICADDGKWYWE